MFARAILDAGGDLVVVRPAATYREGLPVNTTHLCPLMERAADVIRLDHPESTSEARMDASLRTIDDADVRLAVWDGKPARGYGGTADVVAAARERGVPVTIIWPEGARRD
jgi:hypothetical protein